MSKIVAADDEAHILHVVSMKLTNAGYEVLTAVDGEEALELCRAEKPDLLITDNQMPIMTGLQLCQELARDDSTRHIPALMLTARGFDIAAEELAKTNIRDVLSKPFSPREVLAKVQQVLGQTVVPQA